MPATSRPDRTGPKTFVSDCDIPSSAFAFWSRSLLTVCGTSPVEAGPKNADAAPNAAAVTKKSGNVIRPVRSIPAVNASAIARTPPPTSVSATREIVNAASTSPRSNGEPETDRTPNASATPISESPNDDETRPSQRRRNWRSCSAPSFPPPGTSRRVTVTAAMSTAFSHRGCGCARTQAGRARPRPPRRRAGTYVPPARDRRDRALSTRGHGAAAAAVSARQLASSPRLGHPLSGMTPLLARRPAADRSFERLYRRHVGDVYHYALAVLRNRDDAEDVTQTTFLNAYRAYQRGDRPETPKNWLIAIAHNVCRQRFRQAQRRPQESPLFEDAAEAAVAEPDPEHTIEDVRRALSHLAFNQRTALVMRELEGRSYAEIAQIMEISVSAVETLIFRGRRALREQLEGTLTCAEAEFALSKQADGALARPERGQLRAHLRECEACATLARRHRATRGALKAIGLIPLPSSLASFFGGGSAVATGVAAKTAAVVCAGAVVGGVAYEGSKHVDRTPAAADRPAVVVPARVVPAAPSARAVRRTPALAAGDTDRE